MRTVHSGMYCNEYVFSDVILCSYIFFQAPSQQFIKFLINTNRDNDFTYAIRNSITIFLGRKESILHPFCELAQ